MTYIRNTFAAIGGGMILGIRRIATAWPLILWILIVAGLVQVAQLRPDLEVPLLVIEVALVAALYLGAQVGRVAVANRTAARLRADLDAERDKAAQLGHLIHEHYLDAIRDRDMGSDAFERARNLNDQASDVRYPGLRLGEPVIS